jgi:hypothetical protein
MTRVVPPSPRRPATVADITGLRFGPERTPGALVNISRTGLLGESILRCRVGADIVVVFEGGFEPASVHGRVARCEVAAVGSDGLLRYHVAVEFQSPLPIEDDDATQEVETAPAARPATVRNRW